MNQRGNSQVKIQPSEFLFNMAQQYPTQIEVKIEVDTAYFPRVRWFPIPNKPAEKLHRQSNQTPKEEIGILQQLYAAVEAVLMQVVKSSEIESFMEIYESLSKQRFYLLIMLSFARWKAEKRVGQFEKMVHKQWRRREADHKYTQDELQQINRAKMAITHYLRGKHQSAVSQLYRNFEESVVSKVLHYIIDLDKKIRDNQIQQPRQSKDSGKRNDQEEYKSEESQYKMSDQSNQLEEEDSMMEQEEVKEFNQKDLPFFINSTKDTQKRCLYPHDPALKFKRKLLDYMKL